MMADSNKVLVDAFPLMDKHNLSEVEIHKEALAAACRRSEIEGYIVKEVEVYARKAATINNIHQYIIFVYGYTCNETED
jgi:hypothetical protein